MNGLEQILTDLAQAQQALRRSSSAFDDAIDHMHGILAAIAKANHAQGEAITAVVAATDAALRLVQSKGGAQ
jgi:hypothetical protein